MQRISMLIYKYYHNFLPSPLSELFIANNTHHSYYTRQHPRFIRKYRVTTKRYTDYLAFMEHTSGTIFPQKIFLLIWRMLAIKKCQKLN